MSIDLREVAASVATHRYGGFAAHLVDRAREIATAVPADQREIAGTVALVIGLCLAEEDPLNLLGMVGAVLVQPSVKAGRR